MIVVYCHLFRCCTFSCLLRTIFNGLVRHNYVDPDYAYTDDQADVVQRHRQYYTDFIDELRQNRINKLMSK